MKNPNIVCLGGGIGTVNLITGLREFTRDITTVVSLADDGGSAGRLRRLYNTYPLGDIVSCMSVMSRNKDKFLQDLLTYRFPGNRYAKDTHLEGHKVGNLVLFSLVQMTGSIEKAITKFKEMFAIDGNFLPATKEPIELSAVTIDGKTVVGEEKIDLGKYQGKKILDKIFIHPADPAAEPKVIQAIKEADALVFGPGDLYTNILPVMVVPDIAKAIKKATCKKFFVINIANKPFETRDYHFADFIKAVEKHIGSFPFDYVVVNDNFSVHIPQKYRYSYVKYKKDLTPEGVERIEKDLVDKDFPLYHDSHKLAKVIIDHI